jgi:hypothetical protein
MELEHIGELAVARRSMTIGDVLLCVAALG